MNRIYRVVWNRFRRCLVAVNETVSSARQASGKTIGTAAVVAGLTAAVIIPAEALAGRIDTGTISGTETYSADDYISLGTHGMELTITSTGDYTIESNGTMLHAESDVFYNSGVLTITGSGEHQFDDWGYNAVENYAGATFNSDIASMTMAGGNSWIKNWGTANIAVQNFTNNSANVVNYAGGIFNQSGNFTNAANLTNEGTFSNTGTTTIASGGTLDNSGEFLSTGTLTLQAGGSITNSGLLSVSAFSWADGGTYTSNGGTLSTALESVAASTRDYQSMNVIRIGSADAAFVNTSDVWSDLAAVINTTFRDNAVINAGSVIEITTPVKADEAELIRSVIRARFANATVNFTNIVLGADTAFSRTHAFDAELINALIAAGNTGLTYYDRDWAGDLSVGAAGTITGDIGFRKVEGRVEVTDGRTLELVGVNGGNAELATGALIGEGSTLRLGTPSVSFAAGTQGTLPDIENSGTLALENGRYTLADYSGSGTVTVGANADVTWSAFRQTGGSIANAGTMRFGENQRLADTVNTGSIIFEGDAEIAGTFSNTGGAVTLEGALTFAEGASWENGSGTLTTAFGNLFENGGNAAAVGLDTISLNATEQEAVRTTLSELFTKYVPAEVRESVIAHMTFDGAGNVVISDASLTTTQRDDLIEAFAEKFGSATTLSFTGTVSGVSTNHTLTTAKVNELQAAEAALRNATFVNRTFDAEGGEAVFGAGGVTGSAGFAGISNATGVLVKDGLTLELVGERNNDAYLITAADTTVTGAGSELRLGSLGLEAPETWQGELKNITLTDGAGLTVAAGNYSASALEAAGESTHAEVAEGAKLTLGSAAVNTGADLANRGTLTASSDTTVAGTLVNTGKMNLNGAEVVAAGRLENTGAGHTLTALGTITVKGTLKNTEGAELSGTDLTIDGSAAAAENSARLAMSEISVSNGASFTNTGTLTANELVVGEGSYQANGEVPGAGGISTASLGVTPFAAGSRAAETVRSLTVAAGAEKANSGDAKYAEAQIAGTFANTASGDAVFGISDAFPDGAGAQIAETGVLQNEGTVTMAGSLVNKGVVSGAGELVLKRKDALSNLFENSGSVSAGTLTAENITYRQTAGSTEAASGWFDNSDITVTGGTISHERAGSGNAYTIGDGTSTSVTARAEFRRIDSGSTFDILQGGLLHAEEIALDGATPNTVNLTGGTLSTTLDQIFAEVSHKALGIDAESPSDKVDVTGVDVATGVSDIREEISTGINFGWGTVAFNDGVYSASLASDVLQKLDADDADPTGHRGGLEVAFNGAASETFNVTVANAVNASAGGSAAFAVFAGETLTNGETGAPTLSRLYVGNPGAATGAHVLTQSIGFKNVTGVSGGVTVADGRHLVLVGELESARNPSFALLDGKLAVTGEGSMVTLGSYGTSEKTEGVFGNATLTDGGTLRVRHGDFTGGTLVNAGAIYVGGDGVTTVNDSLLRADTDSSLTLERYDAADGGHAENFGRLTVTELMSSGTAHDGTLVNAGTLIAESASIDFELTNKGTADFETLRINEGTLTNSEAGATTAERAAAQVTAESTAIGENGGLINYGTAKLTNVSVAGVLQNSGDATLQGSGGAEVSEGGTLVNDGTLTVKTLFNVKGEFTNTATLTASSATTTTVSGTSVNTETGNAVYRNMTVAAEGEAYNFGHEKGGVLTIEADGRHVNAGTAEWNTTTVLAGGLDIYGSNAENESLVISGRYDNAGTLNAEQAELLTVTGTLTNTAVMQTADVAVEGKLTTAGETSGRTLTVKRGGTHTLTGTADFDAVVIDDGGREVFGSDAANETIALTGSRTNYGTIDATGAENLALEGTLTNAGRATYADMTVAANAESVSSNYEKGNVLSVAEEGRHTNSAASTWNAMTVEGMAANGAALAEGAPKGHESGFTTNAKLTLGGSGTTDVFAVGGLFENHGTLDAAKAETTSVSGLVTNDGRATYADMVITADGTNANAGYEKGQSLTVEAGGNHLNEGAAAWNTASIAGTLTNDEGGSFSFGSTAAGETLAVSGEIVNAGTTDASKIERTTVSGTVTNGTTGSASYADMTIAAGGLVKNAGTETGGTLLIEDGGTHANTGTSSWSAVTVKTGGRDVFGSDALENESFAIAGSYRNEGLLDAADAENVTLAGSVTNTGTAVFDTALVSGSFTNEGETAAAGLTVTDRGTLQNTNSLAADALTVAAGGEFGSSGTLTAAEAEVAGGGILTTSGTTEFGKLNLAEGALLKLDGGTLHAEDLTNARGTTFTQTAGSLTADKGWFEHSTISIEGGSFNAADIRDANGEVSGLLGVNTYNVGRADLPAASGPDSFADTDAKRLWKDGHVVLTADTLTSVTTMNILSGGVLDVARIELTPDSSGATLSVGAGGAVQTSLDQLFTDVSKRVVSIDAVNPETGRIDLTTDVLATASVGGVKDSVRNGMTFAGGAAAVFDDEDFSIELVASVAHALSEAGFAGVTQHYLGQYQGDFTVDLAGRLVAEQEALGMPAVSNPGVVFDRTTFWNVTASGPDTTKLVIGGTADDANSVAVSIGFKNVNHADDVTVTGGREFTLVGFERPADFNPATDFGDSNRLLADAADGGTIRADSGTFTLGTAGASSPTFGWVGTAELSPDGTLQTKNGEFAVRTLNADAGTVIVNEGSTLHTDELLTEGAALRVGGALSVAGDAELTGSLIASGNTSFADLTLLEGSIETSGSQSGNALTIASGTYLNTGSAAWNTVDVQAEGVMQNGAAPQEVTALSSEETTPDQSVLTIGTDAADESFVIAGTFMNNGILHAEAVESTDVSGSVLNRGEAKYAGVNVSEGASLTNLGTEAGGLLSVAGSYTTSGTSAWGGLSVEESGRVVTTGELTIGSNEPEGVFDVRGTLRNEGTLSTENVETALVEGNLVNAGEAHYAGMLVSESGTAFNSGNEAGRTLTIAGSRVNTGTASWQKAEVCEGGILTNGDIPSAESPRGHEEGFSATATLTVGAEGEESDFVIAGRVQNHAELDASRVTTTEVEGTLLNTGRAVYEDLHVASGGVAQNEGRETGNILNVEGSHANSGESIWNDITVEEPGRVLTSENGKTAVSGTFVVRGEYENRGELDAASSTVTSVAGTLINSGKAHYADLYAAAGGTLMTSGREEGGTLTVEGIYTNAGTALWQNAIVTGTAQNAEGAQMTIGGDAADNLFSIAGNFTNNGTLTASAAETTSVSVSWMNRGSAFFDDVHVYTGARFENQGSEEGDALTIEGAYTNAGKAVWKSVGLAAGSLANTGSMTAESLTITGGTLANSGTLRTGETDLSGGTFNVGRGTVSIDKLSMMGGEIVVGNAEALSDANRADLDVKTADPISGHIRIVGNGDVSFGSNAAQFAAQSGAPDIPAAASRITVTSSVTLGETGSIAVGPGLRQGNAVAVTVPAGGLYFGTDSYTVIDAASLGHETPAFQGTNAAGVTVESGAKLILSGISEEGNYVITNDFTTAENLTGSVWTGGWNGADLWAPNTDGSGLTWELTLNRDETKIWVNALLEDIRSKYPDIVLPNNVNRQLDQCKSASSPDAVLTCAVIKNHELSTEEKTRILNSAAEISYAGASMAMALGDLENAAESIESRASMRSEAFTGGGLFRRARRSSGNALWADILGGKQKADTLGVSGRAQTGYDADSYGIIVGADTHLRKSNLMIGFAASYSQGSLDSTGDLLATSNDFTSYGFHLYSAWKPGFASNVIGTLSYQRSNSDITESLPGGLTYSRASASADTDLIALGIRAERHALFGPVAFIPHIGLRAVYGKGAGFETKLDGKAAYSSSPDATFTFGLPIGLSVRGDIITRSGWDFAPNADLTLTPQFGDRSQDMTVQGLGSKASDSLSGDFTSSLVTRFTLGLEATSAKTLTLGARYGFAKGGEGRTDQTFRLEVRKLW